MKTNRPIHRAGRSLTLLLVAAALSAGGCAAGDGAAGDPATSAPASTTAGTRDFSALNTRLAALEQQHGIRYGITAFVPGSADVFGRNADQRFAMCSTFKTYAASAVLRLAEQGKLDLNERVPVAAADIVENSPVTSTAVGSTLSWTEISRAALERSDNTAGNLLLRRIGGPGAITEFARTVGDGETRLDRWETELNEAAPGDPRDTTTPAALAAGYRSLILGDGLSADGRAKLTTWMRASVTSEQRIRKGLPLGWTAADKTGGGSYGSVNDAGVVWNPAGTPLVLVILTRSATDDQAAVPNNQAIADATAAVVDAFSG
ncbi:class A beta-lactamase [Nocardia sp. NPDC024068]|uniref:class A beta-lactamase n=1 Tax=Nocardia sp. NPDC024068 TaxID=3157197 RepID=UPI0033E383A5